MFRFHNIVLSVILCNTIIVVKVFSTDISVPLPSKSSIIEVKVNQEDVAGVHSNTLDIHVAMESGNSPTNLKSIIRNEIKSTLKGLNNSVVEDLEEKGPMLLCSVKYDTEKNNVAMNLDNINSKFKTIENLNNSVAEDLEEKGPIVLRSVKYESEKSNAAIHLDNINAKFKTIESILKDIQMKSKSTSSNADRENFCLKEDSYLGVQGGRSNSVKNHKDIPKNCKDALRKGNNATGVYEIFPKYSEAPFSVLCDMEVKGGGWTHIQKRFDGSQDFFLNWRDYKFGFGNIHGEFWLGLQKIYLLTGFEPTELLVEIVDRDNVSAFAHYTSFAIGSEPGGYKLDRLSGFSGDAGDSLTHHLGSKFSTKDLDFTKESCATGYLGAWWYVACHASNLNGKYINVDLPAKYKFQGLHWQTFRSHEYCHAKARMLVRPLN